MPALAHIGVGLAAKKAPPGFSPWSHSIISGVLLSVAFGSVSWLITKERKTTLIPGALTLSHTVMDVLASPMTAIYPTDRGKSLFFNDNLSIGPGLYSNQVVVKILEYGVTALGLGVYLWVKILDNRKRH